MTEQGLNLGERHAGVEQERGAGVAELMGMNASAAALAQAA